MNTLPLIGRGAYLKIKSPLIQGAESNVQLIFVVIKGLHYQLDDPNIVNTSGVGEWNTVYTRSQSDKVAHFLHLILQSFLKI